MSTNRTAAALIGLVTGGLLGFGFGTQFDYRAEVNWSAVASVASVAVVAVALVPIFVGYRKRRDREKAVRDQAARLLDQIEILIFNRLVETIDSTSRPIAGIDSAAIDGLVSITPDLGMFDRDAAKRIGLAATQARGLVSLDPVQHQDLFQHVMDTVKTVRESI